MRARRPRRTACWTSGVRADRGSFPNAVRVGAALLLLLAPASAAAGKSLPDNGVYFSPGLLVGGAKSFGAGSGLNVGGEISISYYMGGSLGGVVDGLYDLERNAGRAMVGPLVAFGTWGFDGGYLVEVGEGDSHHGGAIRAFLTLGYFSVYVRYGILAGAPDLVEGGVLLKLPLNLSKGKPWLFWPR